MSLNCNMCDAGGITFVDADVVAVPSETTVLGKVQHVPRQVQLETTVPSETALLSEESEDFVPDLRKVLAVETLGRDSRPLRRLPTDWVPPLRARRHNTETTVNELEKESLHTQDGRRLHRLRILAYRLLTCKYQGSKVFDTAMGFIIVFNIVVMIIEADLISTCTEDDGECTTLFLAIVNDVFLGIYTVEVCLRLFVYRLRFFRQPWSLLDLVVVLFGFGGLAMTDASKSKTINLLRMFRLAKVIRVAKVLNRFPMLGNMIEGFAGAIQAMFWGLVLILILLTMWSLIVVQLVNPVNKRLVHPDGEDSWCAVAFSTVMRSNLLFFQTMMAGDSWGYCIIPIINAEPATFIIYALALVTVELGFTNLILAVIVDKASEARTKALAAENLKKIAQDDSALKRWKESMADLDKDGSGDISLEELMIGYDTMEEVQETFQSLSIERADLEKLFYLLDTDDSGTLEPCEFVDTLRKGQMMEPKTSLMLTQLQMSKFEANIKRDLDVRFGKLAEALQIVLRTKSPRSVSDIAPRSSAPKRFCADREHQAEPPSQDEPMLQVITANASSSASLEGASYSFIERSVPLEAPGGFAAAGRNPPAPASLRGPGPGSKCASSASGCAGSVAGDASGCSSGAFGDLVQELRDFRSGMEARFDSLETELRNSLPFSLPVAPRVIAASGMTASDGELAATPSSERSERVPGKPSLGERFRRLPARTGLGPWRPRPCVADSTAVPRSSSSSSARKSDVATIRVAPPSSEEEANSRMEDVQDSEGLVISAPSEQGTWAV